MRSRWYELKPKAFRLRKRGVSIVKIETRLGIPRSTLTGWFRDIILTRKQQAVLLQNKYKGLAKARKKAVIWHNAQKVARLEEANRQALSTLKKIKLTQPILDLALAMLYLGEGLKNGSGTVIGNSNPLILKFFITVLIKNYQVPKKQIKCDLHLRADQDPMNLKKFWSKALGLPLENFIGISIDHRTTGSATFPNYRGVCLVRCGLSNIQRKLLSLSKLFSEKVTSEMGS